MRPMCMDLCIGAKGVPNISVVRKSRGPKPRPSGFPNVEVLGEEDSVLSGGRRDVFPLSLRDPFARMTSRPLGLKKF